MEEIINIPREDEVEKKSLLESIRESNQSFKYRLMISMPENRQFCYTKHRHSIQRMFMPEFFEVPVMELLGAGPGEFTYFCDWNDVFPVDRNRNDSGRFCVETDFDWWICLDGDQTFPAHTIVRLLERLVKGGYTWENGVERFVPPEEIDIVSGLYFKKNPPHAPVSALFTHMDKKRSYPINTAYKGLVKTDIIGMGCVAVRASALAKMEVPYFKYIQWDENYLQWATEDVWFCMQAEKLGLNIWTDTCIECGHLTTTEVNGSSWERYRKGIFDENGSPRRLKPENDDGRWDKENWPGSMVEAGTDAG